MTENNLLLNRIAELMLKHEQHVLPVDLLFDDDQIGDFVKSIQIDSPYQQMLLDGVLSETVREEKLFVYFTIEGYFHFVLGEVIYKKTEGKGAEYLKELIEINKLNGIEEGVEQCLIRDVNKDELKRLMWLIDEGGELLEVCIVPLAYTFLQTKTNPKSEEEFEQAQKKQVNKVITELLEDPTDNDIEILERVIGCLKDAQKHSLVENIYRYLNEILAPDSSRKVLLSLNGLIYLKPEKRLEKINNLEKNKFDFQGDQKIEFYIAFANEYRDIALYDQSLKMYSKALKLLRNSKEHNKSLIQDCLNYIGIIWSHKRNYIKAIKYFNNALKTSKLSLKNDDAIISTYFNNLGTSWGDRGNHKKALEFLEKSLSIRLRFYGKIHPKTATVYNNLGLAYKDASKYNLALKYVDAALQIRLKIYGDIHESTAVSLNNIGLVYKAAMKLTLAVEYFKKSLEVRLIIHGENHPSTLLIYENLISVLLELNLLIEAEQYFQKMSTIYKEMYNDSDVRMAELLKTKANILMVKNENIKAIKCLNDALKLILKGSYLPTNSAIIADYYMEIGEAWCQEGDHHKGIENFKRALDYRSNLFDENGTDNGLSLTYDSLGSAWEQAGNFIEALKSYQKALELNLNLHGEYHIGTSTNYFNIASIYESQKDFENSLKYYQKCLDIDLKTFGDKHPYTRATFYLIGRVCKSSKNYDMAIISFEKALKIDLIHYGLIHRDTLDDYKMIATCWDAKNNYDNANENLQNALSISIKINGDNHSETNEIRNLLLTIKNKNDS
jgi:tetratricopeptide (TPR) repeat protein